MSELADFIRDFTVKQNAILAQYQAGLLSLANDQKTLTRELLLTQKGLSVIDQGSIVGKGQNVGSITDVSVTDAWAGGLPWINLSGPVPLSIFQIDLKGAKKIRLQDSFFTTTNGENWFGGMMAFFSTIFNETPRLIDFAFVGGNHFYDLFETTGAATTGTIDLTTPANLGTLAGTITGTTTSSSTAGNTLELVAGTCDVEIECATAKYIFLIYPLFDYDGFQPSASSAESTTNFPTYQLLG